MDNTKIAGEYLNKGAKLLANKKVDLSIIEFKKAIKFDPAMVQAYFNLALAYQKKGNILKIVESLKNTIRLAPNDAEALNILGYYYTIQGKLNLSLSVLSKALKINPQLPEIYLNLGVTLTEMGKYSEAIKKYNKALLLKPNYVAALTNIGATYARQGKFELALTSYQKALEIDENYIPAYIFLGNVLLAQGSINESVMCYKMAIEKDKKNAEAYNNLGTAYARAQRYGEAASAFKKSLTLDKNSQDALENLAIAYSAAKKINKSIIYLKKAYTLYPKDGAIVVNLLIQMREAGDWSDYNKLESALNKITGYEIKYNQKPGEDPFSNVIRQADPEINYKLARLWSRNLEKSVKVNKNFKFVKKDSKKDKINIGYVSAHFHDHPTNHLTAKLFLSHDKKKFNVFVYSLSPDSCVNFINLYSASFSECAERIYADKIDILIDLDGYTDNNRLQIFAIKPAPIQVTYLGFPGTTGSTFMDYMITDHIVTPKNHSKYYSEKLIYMPDSYQVNNNSQKISTKKYTRHDFGLPEKSLVIACFCGTYKIEPKIFDIWMRILKKIPNSVLWLYRTSELAEKNLKMEAEKRGISPKRLIFSKRLAREKHLARLALADFALDTFTCNGHTTTSDSLRAGVPVITLQGKHFASRVSSSLLTAIGLPELITHSPKEYETLALRLATKPYTLNAIRLKLSANQLTEPLFDTNRFTKNLETAYDKIWKTYIAGKKPLSFSVKENYDNSKTNNR